MRCLKCDYEILSETVKCPRCGLKIPATSSPWEQQQGLHPIPETSMSPGKVQEPGLYGGTYTAKIQKEVICSMYKLPELHNKSRERVKRSSKNPFEILCLNPEVNRHEIIEHGKEIIMQTYSEKERQLIRKAVDQIIKSPKNHLDNKMFTYHLNSNLFTYHKLLYKNMINNTDDFKHLQNLTFLLSHINYDYEFCLLSGFYENVKRHEQSEILFKHLNENSYENALKVWKNILQDKVCQKDIWFIHSLALLHQEWAEYYELKSVGKQAILHWLLSRRYWFMLIMIEDFWVCINKNVGLPVSDLSNYRNKFPEELLNFHWERLNSYMIQDRGELARIHMSCIKEAANSPDGNSDAEIIIINTAVKMIAKFTSQQLQLASEKLEQGEIPKGIRCNYDKAMPCAEKLIDVDPDNERAFQFILKRSYDWVEDLLGLNDGDTVTKVAMRVRPYLERFIERAETSRKHTLENQIIAKAYILQGFFSGDARQALFCYKKALSFDPHNVDATKLLNDTYEPFLQQILEAVKDQDIDGAIRDIDEIPVELKFSVPISEDEDEQRTAKEILSIILSIEGFQFIENGEIDRAEYYLEKAIEVDSENERARQQLADLKTLRTMFNYGECLNEAVEFANKGDLDKVKELVNDIPSDLKFPVSESEQKTAREMLSNILNNNSIQLIENGEYDEAERYLLYAIEIDASNYTARQNLRSAKEQHKASKLMQEGMALGDQEKIEKAIALFKQAIE